MALKRNPEDSIQYDEEISVTSKAKQLFTSGSGKRKAETKILTTFSIAPGSGRSARSDGLRIRRT